MYIYIQVARGQNKENILIEKKIYIKMHIIKKGKEKRKGKRNGLIITHDAKQRLI